MPDDPIVPGGGTPTGGGNFSEDQAALANIGLEASIKMRETMKEVRDILGSLPKVAEDVGKKFTKATTEMKGLVLLADSAQDAFKGIADYSKGLTKTLASDKSLKNMKATLEALKKSAEQAKRLADPKQMRVLDHTIAGVNKRLGEMSTLTEDAFSDEGHENYIRFLKSTNKELEKMSTLTSRVRRGKFTEGVVGARKSLIDAGIMKAGRIEKYAAYGEAAVKLKEAAKAKREMKQEEFAQKRDTAQQQVRKIFGLSADTQIDWADVAKKKRDLAKTAPTGSPAEALKALTEASAVPRTGLMGKLTGGGLVESGAGSIANLASQAAIPLAIAEAVKDLVVAIIDKNAAMNKQAETLASGGILTGTGTSGSDALLAARQNLQPGGILGLNQLGLTIDRSVKMAQTIIESGYAIEELGKGGPMGARRGDFGPGTFGQVQELAATTGRVLGMGDAQSVELTMKLLMQYRESMEGTQNFFTNLTKDTRAAGLSTTKYVSILDEVLGHFDRMNKSLDQVSGTMRALSRTGRMTAEDLQATLGLITGAGRQPMDLASQAFVAIQMRRGPGMAQMEKSGEQNVNANAANISQSLQNIGLTEFDPATVAKYLKQPNGADILRAAVDRAQAGGKYDSKAVISAQAAINKGASAAMGLQYTKQFKAGQMSPLGYATAMTGKGMDEQETANFRRTAMQTMMNISGFTQSDIVQGKAVTPEMMLMLQQAIPGFKEEDITNMRQTLQTGAAARIKVAAEGTDEEKAQNLAKEINKGVPDFSLKMKPEDQGSWIRLLKRWQNDASNPEAHGKVLTYLAKQTETMNDVYDSNSDIAKGMKKEELDAAKEDAVKKAKSVGRVTQDTATIFASVFSVFFNDIISVLEEIRLFFAHSRLFGGVTAGAETEAAGMAADPKIQDKIKTAIEANNLTLKRLRDDMLDTTKTPEEQAALKAQLDTAEKFDREFKQKYGPGSGLGTDQFNREMEDVKTAILSLNDPVTNLMKDMGVKMDQNAKTHEYEYTLSQKEMTDRSADINHLVDMGLAKITPEKTASGDTVYHYQTTHYYDANYVQVTSGDQSPVQSSDGAAATPPPIRPRGVVRR